MEHLRASLYMLALLVSLPAWAGEPDGDGDGLSDAQELLLGTDPGLADTDGDGLVDGIEVNGQNPTDPLRADTDGDALCDGPNRVEGICDVGEDINANGVVDADETDPVTRDTDGGGTADGVERLVDRTNPLDPEDDVLEDSDGDGLSDERERELGTEVDNADSDADGVSDGVEVDGANPTNPLDSDTDGDGLCDGPVAVVDDCVAGEDLNADGFIDAGETDPNQADTDGGGVPDGAEHARGTNPLNPDDDLPVEPPPPPPPMDGDADGDGLSDAREAALGTNPNSADTDGDGVDDGEEVADGTNPLAADTDGDGLDDADERTRGTDPLMSDSDNDLLDDADELIAGTNPLIGDTDGDGLLDGTEGRIGTDPLDADSDDDGILDGAEVERFGSDPNNKDTDGDGIVDGVEAGVRRGHPDSTGFTADADPSTRTDPNNADSDGDGLSDGAEDANRNGRLDAGETDPRRAEPDCVCAPDTDCDGDGLTTSEEHQLGTDPCLPDTDGGGSNDGMEWTVQTDPLDSSDDCTCLVGGDCDGDGLSDSDEMRFGSNICLADTDGGGANDRVEFDRRSDPMDPTDDVLGEGESAGGGARFGCAVGGNQPVGLGMLALLLVLGLRRRGAGVAVLLVALVAVLPGVADAQDNFDVNSFRPMPQRFEHYLTMMSAQPIEGDPWTLGLMLGFADSPLVLRDADDEQIAQIVHRQLVGHLSGSLSVLGVVELGIDVPIILHQTGEDRIPGLGANEVVRASGGIGDIRVIPKLVIYSDDDAGEPIPGGLAVALAFDFYLPTGARTEFQGEGFRFEPRLAMDYAWLSGARLAFNAGYRFREAANYRNIEIDDQITGGLSGAIPVLDALEIVPEIVAAYTVGTDDADTPVEALAALKWYLSETVMIHAGGGTALVEGPGTPDWRVFGGIDFRGLTKPIKRDRDGDGVDDSVDACPDDPEDEDGFEDADGCPEWDNDGDGVLDLDDECPLEAEDKDGVDDADGCPDLDTDGDGLDDINDPCPDAPEDVDGFEDDDGCPDYDDDDDGLADAVDQCPRKPETVNDYKDHDGCPDSAPKRIVLSCERIELKEKVFFEINKATIMARSFALLDEIATVLKENPRVRSISVDGHTDSQGSDGYNTKLSQERAESVRDSLVERGVEVARLEAKGYGETLPIDSNNTEEGRARNRRVELNILNADGCDTP